MKNIIGGLITGGILGFLQIYFLSGTWAMLVASVLMGAFIGWFYKDLNHGFIGPPLFVILSSMIGALFFIILAIQSGFWANSLATGAVTGGIVGVVMELVFPPKYG